MSSPLRILVVDDERLVRETSARQLRDAGFASQPVDSARGALHLLASARWDVVLCDLRMPGMSGLELLRTVRRDHPGVDVILMTAYGSVQSAVAAMREGAVDYLSKPFHFAELEHRLRKLDELRGVRRELDELRKLVGDDAPTHGIIGRCHAMQGVIDRIDLFTDYSSPALVTGETGTGKEMVARALHRAGRRAGAPFIAIPCAAIPGELAESELFGHNKGSFTGAVSARRGAFERADTGTLLLDDIDDLPLAIQAKLLRAVQDGTFTRVGGEREQSVNVRVVATTKVALSEAVAAGNFRDDLFYRLRSLEIQLPPLRARGDDIVLLAEYFLRRFTHAERRADLHFDGDAIEALRRYSWPGNVRELRSAVESAAIASSPPAVTAANLPDYLHDGPRTDQRVARLSLEGRNSVSFNEVVQDVELELLDWALARAGGQQSTAAKLLGLPRTTLQAKLRHRDDG